MNISADRLAAIEARHAACPVGTWYSVHGDDSFCMNAQWVSLDPESRGRTDDLEAADPDRVVAITLLQQPRYCHADVADGEPVATFLVEAHNHDVPNLVAEVRRLQARLAVLEAAQRQPEA